MSSSGLATRLLTAAVLIPAVVAAVIWLPAPAFAVLVAALMLGGFWEWTRLAGFVGRPFRLMLTLLQAGGLAALWWLAPRPTAFVVAMAVAVVFWCLAALWLRDIAFGSANTAGNRWLKWLAGTIAVTGMWAAAVHIRDGLPADGHWWLLACLAVVYGSDTFAYFSGRTFGGRKMAPTISPGKTWAGFVGALLGTVPMALVVGGLLGMRGATLAGWLLLAVVAVLFAIAGDLFESLLKRHRGVKDSGRLFPGHGGLLDRADSLLAALPLLALGLTWLLR